MIFRGTGEIQHALTEGHLSLHAKIKCRYIGVDEHGQKKIERVESTAGRMLLSDLLPRHPKISFNEINKVLTKKELTNLIDVVYRHCGQKETVIFCDRMMKLGFRHACVAGISFGKSDMIIPKEKEKMVIDATNKVAEYEQQYLDGLITKGEKYNKVVDIWSRCTDDVAEAMIKGKMTGIAYELVQTQDHRLPLLEPMSEVAGKLSVLNGAFFLLSQNEGRGLVLGGVVGVPPADVVIIGAGISGRAACNVAMGMGATVTVLDIDYAKLERIEAQFGNRVRTVFSNREAIAREVTRADLLIGAVLSPGAAAPKLITRKMIQSMKKGSVFVDISIDQGGCAETIRPTSLDNPVYVEEGVTHYGVCNMPAQTPRTSTMALTAATLPYILKIADRGFAGAMSTCAELRNALNTHQGALTNHAVSEAVGIRYTSIESALG
ncbi:MAG: hypothetical protein J0M12_13880, partial [Deltaproteobacteria bacterium]|nr:hypothetical protein [Deltaproteobacteria bacterium]